MAGRICNLPARPSVYPVADKPTALQNIQKVNMKKLLVTLLGVTCAVVLSAKAAEGEKSDKSEAKAERKALIEKYDTNKDGKLDKDEQAKMTTEDKEKWAKVHSGKKKKEEAKKDDSSK
jgi:hypothetical protein